MNFYGKIGGKRFSNCDALSISFARERYYGAAVKSRVFLSRLANYGNAMWHVSLITRESVSCSTRPPTMPAAGIMNLNLSLNITSTHVLLADGISTMIARECAMTRIIVEYSK